jgi:hypothetical protein
MKNYIKILKQKIDKLNSSHSTTLILTLTLIHILFLLIFSRIQIIQFSALNYLNHSLPP